MVKAEDEIIRALKYQHVHGSNAIRTCASPAMLSVHMLMND